MDLSTVLHRRLKASRVLKGLKVREFADVLGWSPEKVYRLERGVQVPDSFELAAYARATEQPLTFFLNGDGAEAA